MEKRKNLCAMIPEELHGRVKQEQEALALTLAQYVEMVLEEHFKKGGKEMANGTRTLAFQVSEELFARVKGYLAEHPGLSQREFVIGLITRELERYEAEAAGEKEPKGIPLRREKPGKSRKQIQKHHRGEGRPPLFVAAFCRKEALKPQRGFR